MSEAKKVLIVRPDNLGDVVLALPLAGIIKEHAPDTTVAFLGTDYTRALVQKSRFVDEFHDWSAIAQVSKSPVEEFQNIGADTVIHVYPDRQIAAAAWRARIPLRIGVIGRWFNPVYCNKLVRLRRRNSDLHEVQLNIRLLSPLGIASELELEQIPRYYGWQRNNAPTVDTIPANDKLNVIFHPKSYGHGCEWPLDHYWRLADSLDDRVFRVLITGSSSEGNTIRRECPAIFQMPHVTDATGRYNLETLITLIEQADCLIASGTGPLHIAAAAGTFTIGLYPPVRPIHPGRWGPVGANTVTFCKGSLNSDKKTMGRQISAITPEEVRNAMLETLPVT